MNSPGAAFVAGAVENAGELGISMVQDRWEASLRVRHFGEYPLLEDGSEDGKDIVYYYGANVPGLDPPGEQLEGRVSRVEEPRTVRFGVKYNF